MTLCLWKLRKTQHSTMPVCKCHGACKLRYWNIVERRQHYDPHGWRHIIIVRQRQLGGAKYSVSWSIARPTLADHTWRIAVTWLWHVPGVSAYFTIDPVSDLQQQQQQQQGVKPLSGNSRDVVRLSSCQVISL